MIAKYYRIYNRFNKEPRGLVIVDTLPSGQVSFGWSLCDNQDRFSKKKAWQLARERLNSNKIVATSTSIEDVGKAVEQIPRSLYHDAIKVYLMELRKVLKFKTRIKG